MPEIGENGDGWSVDCSSDEENGSSKIEHIPPPSERVRLYETLDSTNGPLPIQWNWPHGRRAPLDSSGFIEEDDEEEESIKIEEKSDFDFDFDESATPILRKGKASGPKGSAKKKTSSFSGILSNMRRHRQQERMEKEQSTTVRTKR
ncbi:PAXIP1-associated glutamate-rich protein 1 [Frankliniella occidentalis]|uniref:PAXIP1-associated glutamate-rich protein 1 n=1 Tax=Frankliniella occidentalis TaxID=133901 RepID=A0A6J1TCN2_FRAOC|nr:PAXIP1-associated glutamate-rich protein 1 [Frankliniella occidentalis]